MQYTYERKDIEYGHQDIVAIQAAHYAACAIREVVDYGMGEIIECRVEIHWGHLGNIPILRFDLRPQPLLLLARLALFEVQMRERLTPHRMA